MSAKHLTLGQLMEAEGYPRGATRNPRVMRFIGKQTSRKWRKIQRLIRKRQSRGKSR